MRGSAGASCRAAATSRPARSYCLIPNATRALRCSRSAERSSFSASSISDAASRNRWRSAKNSARRAWAAASSAAVALPGSTGISHLGAVCERSAIRHAVTRYVTGPRRIEAEPQGNGRTAKMRILLSPDHSALAPRGLATVSKVGCLLRTLQLDRPRTGCGEAYTRQLRRLDDCALAAGAAIFWTVGASLIMCHLCL
jgi:hypothetical protein